MHSGRWKTKESSKNLVNCAGIESVINLNDTVGKTITGTELDEGLELCKVSCQIGVIF
jgi:gamma-glutamyl phosphate reductase